MNKVLIIVLGLLLLNLGREYVFDDISQMECPEGRLVDTISAELQTKDWDYYRDILGTEREKVIPVMNPLPLVLRGTVVGDPQNSFAIIENLATGQQDLYRLGDTIISGGRIVAMNRDRIIIDHKGAKTELKIGASSGEIAAGGQKGFHYFPGAGERQRPETGPIMNFAELLTQLRIKPYFAGGRCIGFQLSNIRSDVVKQMGLRNGDIIESVNGMRLNDPLRAMQILYNIKKNNPVHLGIERRDEKMELDCRLEG